MYFANRWVPMVVMDTIFLMWAIGALVIVGFMLWLKINAWLLRRKRKEKSVKARTTRGRHKKSGPR